MGVSGSGKSTVAADLARRLGWVVCEGDDLQPRANIAKMRAGTPLADADRGPWLRAIAAWIDARIAAGTSGIVTCSALRRAYRDVLRRPEVTFVLLDGSREVLAARLSARRGHYMPPTLLDSQLGILERPGPDEQAICVDIDSSVADQ